ncbi:MAG: cobalamin biosynthesis protein [Gemmatales bacterium]|nr:cobalamin biosynthesis protein [Gemmatales bacterium]MDW8386879.1 cobalamin biosynthesis protein [Gemmatales bacterium]
MMTELIIAAASPRALETARRLRQALGAGAVSVIEGDAERMVQRLLRQDRPLVCILPAETVVRAVAPLLTSYGTVSPVIWLDEDGRYALALAGDAGAWARRIAAALGAAALGASAVRELEGPDVHLIGRRWGWRIDNPAALDVVARAVRRGEPIAVFQDAGQRDWWQAFGNWPHHFERVDAWPTEGSWAGVIVISDRQPRPEPSPLAGRTLIFRPQTLTLGVSGCRGITVEQLDEYCQKLFEMHGLNLLSLAAVGTSDVHRHEAGLVAFAEQREIPLLPYAADKLALLCHPDQPEVEPCEPAAMLSAGVTQLTVRSTQFPNAFLAVARRAVR